MQKFTAFNGIVAPMDRSNVDTDAIIPKQFLKSIKRSGFGSNLFDEWRYLDAGEPGMDNSLRPLNPEFVLNQQRYKNAKILIARDNFGCGSSREHAPWALWDDGFRVILAPSFADIFFNNCFKNGILPITLDTTMIDSIFSAINEQPGYKLAVDLHAQTLTTAEGNIIPFKIDAFRKKRLLEGLDDIALTLQYADAIGEFEKKHKVLMPWLFGA